MSDYCDVGFLESLVTGMSGYSNVGLVGCGQLGCWVTGMSDCLDVKILRCRFTGVFGYWDVGLLECRTIEMIDF